METVCGEEMILTKEQLLNFAKESLVFISREDLVETIEALYRVKEAMEQIEGSSHTQECLVSLRDDCSCPTEIAKQVLAPFEEKEVEK